MRARSTEVLTPGPKELSHSKLRLPSQTTAQDKFPQIYIVKSEEKPRLFDVVLGSTLARQAKTQKTQNVPVTLLEQCTIALTEIHLPDKLSSITASDALIDRLLQRESLYTRKPLPMLVKTTDDGYELVHGYNRFLISQAQALSDVEVMILPKEDSADITSWFDHLTAVEAAHAAGEHMILYHPEIQSRYQALKIEHIPHQKPDQLKSRASWQTVLYDVIKNALYGFLKSNVRALSSEDLHMLDYYFDLLIPKINSDIEHAAHHLSANDFKLEHINTHASLSALIDATIDHLDQILLTSEVLDLNTTLRPRFLYQSDYDSLNEADQHAITDLASAYYLTLYQSDRDSVAKLPEFIREELMSDSVESIVELFANEDVKPALARYLFDQLASQIAQERLADTPLDHTLAEAIAEPYLTNQPKSSRRSRRATPHPFETAILHAMENSAKPSTKPNAILKAFLTQLRDSISSNHDAFYGMLELRLRICRQHYVYAVPRLRFPHYRSSPIRNAQELIANLKFIERCCKRIIKSEQMRLIQQKQSSWLNPNVHYRTLISQSKPENLMPSAIAPKEFKCTLQLVNGPPITLGITISKFGLLTYKVDQIGTYCSTDRTQGAYDILKTYEASDDQLCRDIDHLLNLTTDPYSTMDSAEHSDYNSRLYLLIVTLFYIEGMRNSGSFITHRATLSALLEQTDPDKLKAALETPTFSMVAAGATREGRELDQRLTAVSSSESAASFLYGLFNGSRPMSQVESQAIQSVTATPAELAQRYLQ